MIPFLLAILAEGRITPALSAFLDAGGLPFEVLDVVIQFFYHGD